jgi:hypothetical protein
MLKRANLVRSTGYTLGGFSLFSWDDQENVFVTCQLGHRRCLAHSLHLSFTRIRERGYCGLELFHAIF